MKGRKGFWLKALGSAFLLGALLFQLDWRQVWAAGKQISASWFVLLLLFFLLNKWLLAWRWQDLLRAQGLEENLPRLYRVALYGQVFNKVLPSNIGGDVVRLAYVIRQHPGRRTEAISATLIDRVLGLLALVTLALLALPFAPLLTANVRGGLFGAGIGSLLFGFLVLLRPWPWLDDRVASLTRWGWGQQVARAWDAVRLYRQRPREFMQAFGLALLFQFTVVLAQALTFLALGAAEAVPVLWLAFPVTNLLSALPISLGGLGLREVSLLAFLQPLGIQAGTVVAWSLVRYALVLCVFLLLLIWDQIVQRDR